VVSGFRREISEERRNNDQQKVIEGVDVARWAGLLDLPIIEMVGHQV